VDVFEQLRLLEEQIKKPIKYFFYYDPNTLNILSIKNFIDNTDTNPYIEISENDMPDKDTALIDNFKIVKNENLLKIIKNDRVREFDTFVNTVINKIKTVEKKIKLETEYKFDLIIEQDIKRKQITFKVSGYIKDEYQQKNINDMTLKFFITAENQTDILYDTYEIELKDLIKKSQVIKYENDEIDYCSIVCCKYFIDYLHLVIE
jgi:hypothetical protein